MNFSNITKISLLGAALSVLAVSVAQARVVPAAMGRSIVPGDNACFGLFFDGVVNNCSSTKSFEVPFVMDGAGPRTGTFVFDNAQANGVSCAIQTSNGDSSGFQASAATSSGATGLGNMTTGAVTVAGGGKVWLSCSIGPGSKLLTIGYAP